MADSTSVTRRSGLPATTNVLILLCAMYFISYIVRQNVSTAIIAIRPEFKLSNTQAGLIFSAFGYPYLLFQIIGGLTADKFGPRKTLFISGLVWAGATVLTGLLQLRGESRVMVVAPLADRVTEENEVEVMTAYHRRLESLVRLHPAHWPWLHDRWRARALVTATP